MYALIKNNIVVRYPYTVTDLRLANRDTSFPNQMSDEALLEFGMHKVESTSTPLFSETQVLEEGTPVFDQAQQQWKQVLTVRDMTADEIQQRYNNKANELREVRNDFLKNSDWAMIVDVPVDKSAWLNYRQALRDIPTQSGFPFNVEFPVQP
tara:strand:+ start:70 stop:525 length:456 start_codon:yes stop_codon:yes gene_type:complete